MSNEITLRNRDFILDPSQRYVLALMLFIAFVLPLIAVWFIFGGMTNGHGTQTAAALIKNLLSQVNDEAFAKDPLHAAVDMLIICSLFLYILYFYLASRFERLMLTATGIRYTSPLPDAFRFLRPGWYIPWDQITRAVVRLPGFGMDSKLATLELQTRTGNRRLRPIFWVNPDTWVPPKPRMFDVRRRSSPDQALKMIEETALVSHVRIQVRDVRIEPGRLEFHLEDNPWSGGMAVLLLVLLGYALVDTFIFKSEVLAETPPYLLYAVGGLLVTLVCHYILQRTGVPRPTGIGLAVMTGLAFGAAMHPALIRLNELTDRAGLVTYTYFKLPDGSWQPESDGLPSLKIDQAPEYWLQFKPGSTHGFTLRKGGLGFWQLDEVPLRDAYHDYFDRIQKKRTQE
jgi:hypothetical protein